MKFSKFTAERDNQRAEILFMRIAVVVVLALLANAGASLSVRVGQNHSSAPERHQTFWVSGQKVSTKYLQEMAYGIQGLPSRDAACGGLPEESLSRDAAPSEYGAFRPSLVQGQG